ncbi:hypothetical protein H8F21_19200 [Pseudomonas sp. P66]|jgi:hypothetical protein|uniref:Uncharacterized protein n=1 Tax=Pseudomonas arcuscaelestis TaxID=2710591 RepID=A0ABS2C1Y1_9PSED|nr:hypothetical protein [Pseudomonas arcuscaelestis]MBM3110467.1 hypothetical protein [Pseudomonas arcuscaelestis]MBM5459695.1 hypothetical protein [Pseudomonas arcuscaelestis]
MNRQTYFALPHLTQFTDWLAAELDSQSRFKHEYVDRRSATQWSCNSLFDAFSKYRWNHPGNARLGFNPGSCSASNGLALAALRKDLQRINDDDARALEATLDVMRWGGVSAGNAKWLTVNKAGLANAIKVVQVAMDAGDERAPTLRAKQLRFNSGMTKVYSLLCKNFVIYDSRVAAALGWVVVKYCRAHNLPSVPQALSFPWAGAKEAANASAPKRRNPGIGNLQFKGLRSGSHHALWNLRANWLLTAVLAHPAAHDSPFHSVAAPYAPLRALEAALFMIGYDLGDHRAAVAA